MTAEKRRSLIKRFTRKSAWRLRLANAFRQTYGFIASGKYFDGAQMLTVKLLQPRMRNSRMIRM
jgi:hypothetical protein